MMRLPRTWVTPCAVALLLVFSAGCATDTHTVAAGTATTGTAAPPPSASATPGAVNSMVVLGHSGATGFGSDPASLGRDAYENSWATGTNPDVKSVYQRLLAQNPTLKGHNYNYAKDGSRVDDLVRQTAIALELRPSPDLVLIQTIDNDIRCDGTDAQNYGPFGATLLSVLDMIRAGAPNARILLVSQWGSVERGVEVGQQLPFSVTYASGDGPCDVYTRAAQIRPDKVRYLQDVVAHYHAELKAACAQVAQCRTDDGAMQQLDLVLGDLVADGNHLSVQGHQKMAAIAWDALH